MSWQDATLVEVMKPPTLLHTLLCSVSVFCSKSYRVFQTPSFEHTASNKECKYLLYHLNLGGLSRREGAAIFAR